MDKLSLPQAKAALKAIAEETKIILDAGSVGPLHGQARRDYLLSSSLLTVIDTIEAKDKPSKADKPSKSPTAIEVKTENK